jgi:hypothetical protein
MNMGGFIQWGISLASKIREWYVIASIICIELDLNRFIVSVKRLLLRLIEIVSERNQMQIVRSHIRNLTLPLCRGNRRFATKTTRAAKLRCSLRLVSQTSSLYSASGPSQLTVRTSDCGQVTKLQIFFRKFLINIIHVSFEVLSAVAVKSFIFWDITDLPEEHVASNFRVKA